jgi:hypothetical protein
MKKYLVISNVVLLGVVAFLLYANYLQAPAEERAASIEEEIRTVDSIAATYKGVVFNEEEDIPNCCGYDEKSPELFLFQTAITHKNGIPKFALVWTRVKDGSGFKLEDGYIWFFRNDGVRIAERYRGKWTCANFAEGELSKIQHVVENPESCLAIK